MITSNSLYNEIIDIDAANSWGKKINMSKSDVIKAFNFFNEKNNKKFEFEICSKKNIEDKIESYFEVKDGHIYNYIGIHLSKHIRFKAYKIYDDWFILSGFVSKGYIYGIEKLNFKCDTIDGVIQFFTDNNEF